MAPKPIADTFLGKFDCLNAFPSSLELSSTLDEFQESSFNMEGDYDEGGHVKNDHSGPINAGFRVTTFH